MLSEENKCRSVIGSKNNYRMCVKDSGYNGKQ